MTITSSQQCRSLHETGGNYCSLTGALGTRSGLCGEIWNSSVVNTETVSLMALDFVKMTISITSWDVLTKKERLLLGGSKHTCTQGLH